MQAERAKALREAIDQCLKACPHFGFNESEMVTFDDDLESILQDAVNADELTLARIAIAERQPA